MGAVIAMPAAAVARALATPTLWVAEIAYGYEVAYDDARFPRHCETVQVVEHAGHPDPHDLIPEGAIVRRASIFPADRLSTMPMASRHNYRRHYKAVLLHRCAALVGKPVAELVPWRDYDGVFIDYETDRWALGSAFSGE